MSKRTRERQKAKKKQQQRQRQLIVLGIVGVAVVIGVILFIVAAQPVSVEIDEAFLTRYDDIPTSFTDEGFPVLGDAEAAAVQMEEYSSFDCPSCGRFHEDVTEDLVDRIRDEGNISFTYVPLFGTGGLPNGEGAARAALCAGEQGRFWEYHDLLFEWQREFLNSAYSQNRLLGGARALGLDMGDFRACASRNNDSVAEVLADARVAFSDVDGATGTPTLVINGETLPSPDPGSVNSRIEQILALAPPPIVEVEEEPADEPDVVEEAEDEDATDEASTDTEADESEADTEADEEVDADAEEGSSEDEEDAIEDGEESE